MNQVLNGKKKISFNNDLRHFEPTDVVHVKKGETIERALRDSPFSFLLQHEDILKVVLFFNGIFKNNLLSHLEKDLFLVLNHPKMYEEEFHGHPCFHAYRNRSFNFLESKIVIAGKKSILDGLKQATKNNCRILEIGCGTGRALLEVQNQFPTSEVVGICLQGEKENLEVVRSFFELPSVAAAEPVIHETDLNSHSLLNIIDGEFDFIFSHATLRYVREKVDLFGTIYQALKVGGVAALELRLIKIIDQHGNNISLHAFFNQKKWKGIFYYNIEESILFIYKNLNQKIEFGLQLIEEQTKHQSAHFDPLKNNKVGWLSVYRLDEVAGMESWK